MHFHFHCVFLEGVFVDRVAQGLKPRFLQAIPPTDADIAAVIQKIGQRVIRQLRKLGYLETGTKAVVPTGYDPALVSIGDSDPPYQGIVERALLV